MLPDPILNNGNGYCDSLFPTDCTTLLPFGEVVLHEDNNVSIVKLHPFDGTH